MLRVTQQADSQAAKRYYSKSDYLSQGQEIVGSWGGKGALRLGLSGVVDKDSFDRLCDNLDPRTGKQLTARTRSDRTVLYDFTWSVPKSVSVLYALTGDEEILTAFRESVNETMREDAEPEMKTRVRKGGKDEDRVTGNMIWAEFIHTTSRPVDDTPDCQLHAHLACLNATSCDQERRWKAGQFCDLKRDAPYFQSAMRVRLANKLQDLGFGIVRKRDAFEIAGVPASVIKKFSRRTDVIEKTAAEKGITDPKRKAELGAETREKKSKELSWNALRKEWDSRLTHAERQALAAVHRREVRATRPERGEGMAVDHALEHVFTRKSVAGERELLTEALKRGLGSVTVPAVVRELARRSLIRSEKDGRAVATTSTVLAEEQQIVDYARQGRGRFRPLGDADRPFVRDWLNADQKAVVRHVLGSRDRVTLIRGAAGTGKTTLEQELGDALAEAGKRCVAIAQSASASRGVLREEAGFPTADTVARFLKDAKMREQARNGVVLLDEASLMGSKDMLTLFRAAEELGARLVILGDRRQHRAVSRGQPLKLLEEEAGLPVAEVKEILRQSGDYKKVSQALADGRTAEGFGELDRMGWIKELPDAERYRALADAYLSAVREKRRDGSDKSALVITPTHAEAARITDAVRADLKAAGKLGDEHVVPAWIPAHLTDPEKADAANYATGDLLAFHQHAPGIKSGSRLVVGEGDAPPVGYADRFEVYRPASIRIAAGDRVRITANGRTREGHRLNNGSLYTVKGFTRRGDVVLDNNWVVPTEGGVHLAHGYAVTSQASQGRGVDKVYAALSSQSFPATTQRTAYVAFTRGKEQVVVYTDDKKELLKAVQRPDEPMSAIDLARARGRNRPLRQRLQKHLAHLRRRITFAQTHPSRPTGHEKTPHWQREMGHER